MSKIRAELDAERRLFHVKQFSRSFAWSACDEAISLRSIQGAGLLRFARNDGLFRVKQTVYK
ncbi:MAG: hypothetical protein QOD11_603 [Bradyrhizobium sp.]|jgi:hypothetical protein|nr:hypothetical protein [Bradyrhizobium sp.]